MNICMSLVDAGLSCLWVGGTLKYARVFICRMLKLTSELDSPTLTLAADLSSLRFHVDEEKVRRIG